MARKKKIVEYASGLDRRETGYYSTPNFVAEYIASQLIALRPDAITVLDPCVGQGELTSCIKSADMTVYGIDILDFSPEGVDTFRKADFIEMFIEDQQAPLMSNELPSTDIIIANPPYNCHEVDYLQANKKRLAAIFGSHATLNMYSLFLTAIIRLARPNTAIGVIIHDSFLTARGHEALREEIIQNCSIHSLHLCPTDLFFEQGADVRTCILILQKNGDKLLPATVSNRPASSDEFQEILREEKFTQISQDQLCLMDEKDRKEFLIGVPAAIRSLFSLERLGDLFPCVTGISTGKDGVYLSPSRSEKFQHPFYKNPGSRRFFTSPDAYIRTDFLTIEKEVPNFMVRNKRFLFEGGLTCSSMGVAFGAAILPEGGLFGVNANIIVGDEDRWWLLAFLNSSLCTYIVRGVMIRSNMITAGYVSRIPIPHFSDVAKTELSSVAKSAFIAEISPKESRFYIAKIDTIINEDLSFSEKVESTINEFCADVVRLT